MTAELKVQRLAAFADGQRGGNPAGVVICEALPDEARMQAAAKEVGYSETAFAAQQAEGWRVRYFAPEMEIPFCGHATIALGAALALAGYEGAVALETKAGAVTVEGWRRGPELGAALQSPPTRSRPAPPAMVAEALELFDYAEADLDPTIPPAITEAGAPHLTLALVSRERLAAMRYVLEAGRRFMSRAGLVTVNLVQAEGARLFHSRNLFASGGVYEDPATGAAAAALAGYLRVLGWPHGGAIDIIQGADMGVTSRIRADIGPEPGSSIRVSGAVRLIP